MTLAASSFFLLLGSQGWVGRQALLVWGRAGRAVHALLVST